jgi:hypothetical protein
MPASSKDAERLPVLSINTGTKFLSRLRLYPTRHFFSHAFGLMDFDGRLSSTETFLKELRPGIDATGLDEVASVICVAAA